MSSATSSTASLSQGYPVYLGLWTNWSRGRVLGATLTITRQDANLLIAFTSTFIAFVASRVWRSICFILHRQYSISTPQDASYHQVQAILRNASAAEDGLRLSLNLLSTSLRRKHKRNRRRILFIAVVGIALIASFTTLGGFSSRITFTNDEVLIDSARCGYLYVTSNGGALSYFDGTAYQSGQVNNALNYVQQCYSNISTSNQAECDHYAATRITGHAETNASCPFDNAICITDRANIRIDSGYINSHTHFGLNSPPEKRVLWRNILQCAPLVTDGYTSRDSQSPTNDTLYHYGTVDESDVLFAAQDLATQYEGIAMNMNFTGIDAIRNFLLGIYAAYVADGVFDAGESDFAPIDALFRKDADIQVVSLSGNGVLFSEPSDDLWYNLSKTPISFSNLARDSTFDSLPIYLPRAPASILGCTSQHQFCHASGSGGCGPLAGFHDAVAAAAPLFNTTQAQIANMSANTEEGARFTYLVSPLLNANSPTDILHTLGPEALSSQTTLSRSLQGTISSDQWQQDVIHWWDILMAYAQGAYLESAYGPSDVGVQEVRANFTAPAFNNTCHNQKFKTTAFISLSVFGLVFTYVSGILLILLSYCLEPAFTWLHKTCAYEQYKHLEWTSNATLQLQRLAHEGIGHGGTWTGGTEIIPTTENDELLAPLDISNLEHPVLCPLVKAESVGTLAPPDDSVSHTAK
ncbi:hypothetical protein F5Y16DRAFT_405271 [Xylariaceae sp. FL0255]|nr:hypothetical protein F5Y16DRAFT_405271 [Xylariaceae sp. FL0255]